MANLHPFATVNHIPLALGILYVSLVHGDLVLLAHLRTRTPASTNTPGLRHLCVAYGTGSLIGHKHKWTYLVQGIIGRIASYSSLVRMFSFGCPVCA